MKTVFEFYTDGSGRHRWRRTSGKEIVESQQGYSYPSEAIDNARRHGYELPIEELVIHPEKNTPKKKNGKATKAN